jgi:hypothetical protein
MMQLTIDLAGWDSDHPLTITILPPPDHHPVSDNE